MLTAEPTTFASSELSRNAPRVFAAAEQSPVDVTRRDGEDLVLMSKREADARAQLLGLAAQLITVAIDDRGSLTDRMTQHLPWMLALRKKDRKRCARELVDAARASFATGQPHLAVSEMAAWMETASAIAAGLHMTEVTWLDRAVLVERP